MNKKEQVVILSILDRIDGATNEVDILSKKIDTILYNNAASILTQSVEVVDEKPQIDKKLLVIMASYNSSKTIGMAADSILNQTHQNIHLCIVDDNSSDDTVDIVTDLYKDNSRVSLYKLNDNRGSYVTRNVALRENIGECDYWVLHDSDDYAYPDRFYFLLNKLEQEEDKLTINCGFIRKDFYTKKTISKKDNSENSVIYNRTIFDKLGYYDENTRYGGDSEYRNRFYSAFGEDKLFQTKQFLFDAYITGQNCTIINKIDSSSRKKYINQFRTEIKQFEKDGNFFRDFTLPTTEYKKIL